MDIKAGEEHVRSEARDWRERALKAQAEIKRLQAEMDTDHVQHMLNIKRKDAEIKRLRAALERIANYFPDDCHKFQTTEAVNMKEIAREALKDDL